MSSVTRSLRADEREFELWLAVAGRLGLSFNRWARAALNDQCELDESLLRERQVDDPQAGFAPGLES